MTESDKWAPYLPVAESTPPEADDDPDDIVNRFSFIPEAIGMDIYRLTTIAEAIMAFDQQALDTPFIFPESVSVVVDHLTLHAPGSISSVKRYLAELMSSIGEEHWGHATHYTVGEMLAWSYFRHRYDPNISMPFILGGGADPKTVITWYLREQNEIGYLDANTFWLIMTTDIPMEWLIKADQERHFEATRLAKEKAANHE